MLIGFYYIQIILLAAWGYRDLQATVFAFKELAVISKSHAHMFTIYIDVRQQKKISHPLVDFISLLVDLALSN